MTGRHCKGRREKGGAHRSGRGRFAPRTLIISSLLLLTLAVGGTLAYIAAKAGEVQNQFIAGSVTSQVNETNGTIDVTNTGNVNAYIRAAIAVNWMDSNENVRGLAPKDTEYSLSVNTTDWWQNTDGYYYYKYAVSPGADTSNLVQSFALADGVTPPNGYTLTVEVVAEAIQADGETDDDGTPAYEDAWGVDAWFDK